MRTAHITSLNILKSGYILILSFFLLFVSCNSVTPNENKTMTSVTETNLKKVVWNIKAIRPDGTFLDIKAIDDYGKTYDVKGIQEGNQKSIIDIKAFIGNKIVNVKLLVNHGKLAPVEAIAEDGTLYDIKAIATNGDRLNVMGVQQLGNIIDIKALDKNDMRYNVKAISPDGEFHDVKGVKTSKNELEYTLYGADIYAHVKALPQTGCDDDNFLWHIVALNYDGFPMEIKAKDNKNHSYDVKAIRNADQTSILDIKAFVGEIEQLPVKIILSNKKYETVAAIGDDGTLYPLKAISKDGTEFDVDGIQRSGNVIDIKAIGKDGSFFGVKALSPDGELDDVKGIKMFSDSLELKENGVEIYAHVKAISPS